MEYNSIEKAKYIDSEYREYLKSSFKFGDSNFQNMFEDELSKVELYKGPYLDLSLPFETSHSINELIAMGIITPSFKKISNINYDQKLYVHQELSLDKISKGRNVVITTGTGSGKTECFLYPILNSLIIEKEKGNSKTGIKALFLYPMNALVNDQIDRVRKLLINYPNITYGFYTGETPEKESKKYRDDLSEELGIEVPSNELLSREVMRETPPDLLFTNYSMLEYMLIRPQDLGILSSERLDHWKYVVLDEAHTYNGALGIEISMLLKRVTSLCNHKIQFILTSATLGEQNKSEEEILKFASNLTSSIYEKDDIIFSKRKLLDYDRIDYYINPSFYTKLDNTLSNLDELKQLSSQYLYYDHNDVNDYLFDLLIHDGHLYKLYEVLHNETLDFKQVLEKLSIYNFHEEDLVSFIHLINNARKGYSNIFDIKYHSFVRALSGAYITLGQNPSLTLTKTLENDGLKTFEVGNCRYCNSSYILGKMIYDRETGFTKLYQNSDVDIYENYGEIQNKIVDYFLLDDNFENLDDSVLSEYEICSKCGAIFEVANLNHLECQCEKKYRKKIYKVNRKKDDFIDEYNNIGYCPCCNRQSKNGIIRTISLGKDEGTALIGQILYRCLGNYEPTRNIQTKKINFKNIKKINDKPSVNNKVKQFITFSDSRQQASFSAVFFDANHTRFLQKRLIWKVIENSDYEVLRSYDLVSCLTRLIKEYNLFHNDLDEHKHAWITMLVELLQVDGVYGAEGLGLFHFELDLDDLFSDTSEEEVREYFGKYGLNKKDLLSLIQVIFSVFRRIGAIDSVKSTLTPHERFEYLGYRRFINYVALKKDNDQKNIYSFLPKTSQSKNKNICFVKKVCNCSIEEAAELMEQLFMIFADSYFKKHEIDNTYQIDSKNYIIKNYKNCKYYRCSKCGKITPFNVHGLCTEGDCKGHLEECDTDLYFKNNYYRKEYKNKIIEPIIIKEHTAQLDRKEAKKYQKDFKDKKINILSCSTTFEMGVDIGGLETVFMRNVPPTPANYVQRAGRAGRRKDSSAFVITYCGNGSHDYTYFSNPTKMISGKIKPPYFNVVNKKIIIRHIYASAFGFFFKESGNGKYFKNIGVLNFNGGIDKFKEYIESKPDTLNNYINKILSIDKKLYGDYSDFKWYTSEDMRVNLTTYVENLTNILKDFENARKKAVESENYKLADYYSIQESVFKKKDVIDSLSTNGIIPKYGFPTDVVNLDVYNNGLLDATKDLNRDLKIAISEYAPDSEIIADGVKYTSKYISLPRNGDPTKHYYHKCSKCHKLIVSLDASNTLTCPSCGNKDDEINFDYFIEPKDGFKTGMNKENTRMKPKRSYSGEIKYLGQTKDENCEYRTSYKDVLIVNSIIDAELLILNTSDFYFCPICGYGEITKKTYPKKTLKHINYKGMNCINEELDKISLGHRFKTDVVKLNIKVLNIYEEQAYAKALSFLYAMLEGISIALNIERRDINGVIEINSVDQTYDIILFDDVAGGAGHVKRLLGEGVIKECLISAKEKVSQKCCDENTSCYNCLRNYHNQTHHAYLKRKYALDIINDLLMMI